MKIKIVYIGSTPHIYFDDKEVRGVFNYSVTQKFDEQQALHLDVYALEGIEIEYKQKTNV